ncbi:MAG: caspase family protein [bacterium]
MRAENEWRKRATISIFLLAVVPTVFAQTTEKPALVLQAGHTGSINSVVYSADGKTFLTASDDQTVKLWDSRSGRVIRIFTGHGDGVIRAVFSPDGKSIFSVCEDSTARMWDVATGRVVRDFAAEGKVSYSTGGSLAVSPGGKYVVVSHHKTHVWDVTGGQLRWTIDRPLKALTFSPDGKSLAAVFNEKQTVQLLNPQTGELQRELPANPNFLHEPLAFSPDGKLLAVVTRDSTVDLWDWAKGHVVRSFQDEHYVDPPATAFSPDGKRLLISNAPGRAIIKKYLDVYDVVTGKLFRRIDVSNLDPFGDSLQANAVFFYPDGRTFLTAGYVHLAQWDVAGGTLLRAFETAPEARAALVVDPARKRVLLGVESVSAKLWDANFSVLSEFADSDAFGTFYFSPDRRLAATDNTSNYYLRFWDAGSGQLIAKIEESVSWLRFSPEGQALAILKDGNTIHIYDSQTVKLARTLRGHTGDVKQALFTPDGKSLVSIGEDMSAKVWDWRTGELLRTLEGLKAVPTSLALDNKTVAVAANDGVVTVWDLATGQLRRSWPAVKTRGMMLALSPDGKTVATASVESRAQLWDAGSGEPLKTFAGEASRDFVSSLAFGPDGQSLLAREDYEGLHVIKLWNVASGQLVRRWGGGDYDPRVNDVSFSKDGRALLIAADLQFGPTNKRDTATQIYSTATGELLADVIGFADGSWVVVTPDGLFDGVPDSWAKLNWRFGATEVAPLEAFFNEFYYPGLLVDLLSGIRPTAPRNISQLDRRQPEVELAYAEKAPGEAVTTRTVRLRLKVTEAPATPSQTRGGGAQDVRLFRNSLLVKAFRGDVLEGQKSVTLDTDVPVVAGENQFTAYAFNRDNVKSDDAVLRLTGDDSLSRTGIARVLAVGVNVYANPQFNLRYAVADAQEFGAEFERQQSRLSQFDSVGITSLLDAQATKANVLQQLSRLAGQSQPEDAVVVFFAGHGVASENQFYLLPHDLGFTGRRAGIDAAGLKMIFSHSISDRELEQAFAPLYAGNVLLVIDACDSGQALEAEEKRRGPMNSKGLAQLAYEKGMYILTAAQSYQAAQEVKRFGHGLLTYALVEEGLKKGAADAGLKDGQVLAREWLDYATDRVPRMQLETMLEAARGRGVKLAFVEGEEKTALENRSVQRPRVFYRRELTPSSFVVARP